MALFTQFSVNTNCGITAALPCQTAFKQNSTKLGYVLGLVHIHTVSEVVRQLTNQKL